MELGGIGRSQNGSICDTVEGRFGDVTNTILKQLNDNESSSSGESDNEIDETYGVWYASFVFIAWVSVHNN